MSPRSFICVIFSPVQSPRLLPPLTSPLTSHSPAIPPPGRPEHPGAADQQQSLIVPAVVLHGLIRDQSWRPSNFRLSSGLSQQARWKVLFWKWWMWREWLMRRLWRSRASYKMQGFIVTPKFTQESYLQFHETISFIKLFTVAVRLPASLSRHFLSLDVSKIAQI